MRKEVSIATHLMNETTNAIADSLTVTAAVMRQYEIEIRVVRHEGHIRSVQDANIQEITGNLFNDVIVATYSVTVASGVGRSRWQ